MSSGADDNSNTTVHVRFFPRSITKSDLQTLFAFFGPLKAIELGERKNWHQRKPEVVCQAFVTFENRAKAEQAIKELQGVVFPHNRKDKKKLELSFATPLVAGQTQLALGSSKTQGVSSKKKEHRKDRKHKGGRRDINKFDTKLEDPAPRPTLKDCQEVSGASTIKIEDMVDATGVIAPEAIEDTVVAMDTVPRLSVDSSVAPVIVGTIQKVTSSPVADSLSNFDNRRPSIDSDSTPVATIHGVTQTQSQALLDLSNSDLDAVVDTVPRSSVDSNLTVVHEDSSSPNVDRHASDNYKETSNLKINDFNNKDDRDTSMMTKINANDGPDDGQERISDNELTSVNKNTDDITSSDAIPTVNKGSNDSCRAIKETHDDQDAVVLHDAIIASFGEGEKFEDIAEDIVKDNGVAEKFESFGANCEVDIENSGVEEDDVDVNGVHDGDVSVKSERDHDSGLSSAVNCGMGVFEDEMGQIGSEDVEDSLVLPAVGISRPRTQGKFTRFITRVKESVDEKMNKTKERVKGGFMKIKAWVRKLGCCCGREEEPGYVAV
ncbi:hypothetical protein HDU76_012858 [Blyttiomyces sp. JEL0837]|nr:hypothetical protein HDU76_012858 [Blyttiomyces sp. JEL0837]